MAANASYDLLSSLLPTTSFALAYALPLLFVSIFLTFAGAFLTLDRTRTFPANTPLRSTTQPKTQAWLSSASWTLFLHGGVGGLCSGYAFGVYFTTFLSLLIPNTTSSANLSPKSFLAVWVLSVLVCMAVVGRWKYASLAVSGTTGFASTALSISVIAHPSLVTRIALLAVFTTVGTVLCLLPFPRVRCISTRFACTSAGSFGLVVCIAILKRNASWGNVWERMYLSDGDNWGTSDEKGLSAAYCLLLCAGLACDTFLHRKFGENPDEKWDHYLAKLADNLPNDASRAGTFTPFVSLYDRIMGREHDFAPIVPQDEKFSSDVSLTEKPPLDTEASVPLGDLKPQPGFLRKKGTTRIKGARLGRRPVKFLSGDEEYFSSSDDEVHDLKARPSVPRSMSVASSATLTNSQVREDRGTLKPPSRKIVDVPDYSDYEEDLGLVGKDQVSRDDPNWTPQFIRRHSIRSNAPRGEHITGRSFSPVQRLPVQTEDTKIVFHLDIPPPDLMSSVPATPSLLKAVDRITAAYTSQATFSPSTEGLPVRSTNESAALKSWDTFWADVKVKARN